MNPCQHWSQVEYLHLTVTNPNICLKGQHSYYSGAWDGPFEEVAVRYLHGDPFSRSPDTGWEPLWHIDRLHIGDYVQIAAGVKIIMGGNHTHNTSFISTYPFADLAALQRSYRPAGDTRIGNDVWIGMEAMIMPGVTIGDGAIIAARFAGQSGCAALCHGGRHPGQGGADALWRGGDCPATGPRLVGLAGSTGQRSATADPAR